MRLFRRQPKDYVIAYEHPTQRIASGFLRAVADDDPAGVWERLSRETRGLLEGMHALRAGLALNEAAGSDGAERVGAVVAPLRSSVLRALGGTERVLGFGVSAARTVDRQTAYVLLLADIGMEGILDEAQWRPAHLLAFTYESREWLVDLGRTAALSGEAGLPDPLGPIS